MVEGDMLAMLVLAAAVAHDGKTMAVDDWQTLSIVEVGSSSAAGSPYYLSVRAGDLDGDGTPDEAYLKLICAGGELKQAFYAVKGPRDTATQAGGRRTHNPMTFVKEWSPAS